MDIFPAQFLPEKSTSIRVWCDAWVRESKEKSMLLHTFHGWMGTCMWKDKHIHTHAPLSCWGLEGLNRINRIVQVILAGVILSSTWHLPWMALPGILSHSLLYYSLKRPFFLPLMYTHTQHAAYFFVTPHICSYIPCPSSIPKNRLICICCALYGRHIRFPFKIELVMSAVKS